MQNNCIIDLFAGCGGMSLGFEIAGYNSVVAVEKDDWASDTYAYNHPDTIIYRGDITQIENPAETFKEAQGICGIIGGPPCQGFSLSGNRDPKDPRNSLFMDYMRFVESFQPKFFVMENVPGILSAKTRKGESVQNLIKIEASNIGYNIHQMVLNAAQYGVPQSRMRVFFIGIRKDFPFDPSRLVPEEESGFISIADAISDLPVLQAGEGQDDVVYPIEPQNPYQQWCRSKTSKVCNHIAMRHTQRLVERFRCIKWGESLADVPDEHKQRKRGDAQQISGKTYAQNNMRPFPDKPSPTIPASFQSNFVHPFYDRNYTAREGARLQSFPDWYVFQGKRTTMSWEKSLSQYQQIGNAVPPLLAKAIASTIKNYFDNISSCKNVSVDIPAEQMFFDI